MQTLLGRLGYAMKQYWVKALLLAAPDLVTHKWPDKYPGNYSEPDRDRSNQSQPPYRYNAGPIYTYIGFNNIVAADALAPTGARASVGTMLIYK